MSASRPAPIRTATDRVVVGVLLVGGVALLAAAHGLAAWLGAAMLVGGLYELRPLLPTPLPARVRHALPYLVLGAAFVALFWEPLLGRPPATRDHGIHYYQTQLLYDELLPSGRLWGWSASFGAGYPFGESYPVLGYLLSGLAHALSGGLISLRTSYAWGVAGTWGLGTVAVGWLAHGLVARTTGERRGVADWAFCAAGVLWLFDAGASRQGGWNYLMFHGVWPQMLSAVLWTLSLSLLMGALDRPSPRRIGAAALVLGASVAAHPFGMLAAAASGGLWLVALLVSATKAPAPLRTWAAVHVGAVAVCLGVVLVFFGSADGMARSPVPWSPLGELAYETATGTLFPTHWAWLGPAFIVGALALIRRPHALGTLALLLVLSLLVLGSHEAMTVLQLDLLIAGFKNLQFPRYTIELKPVMFAVAGVGAALLPGAVRSLGPRRLGRAPAWVLAVAIAPMLTTGLHDLGRVRTRPVGALDTLEANPQGKHEDELRAALQAEAHAHDGPLRVAFFRNKMSGGTYPIFAITDAGARLVLDGHVPAVNFKHRIRRAPTGYDALGVTHVIYDRPLPDNETRMMSRLTEVGRFGAYHLARYTPEGTAPRARIDRGALELLVDETERVELDVQSDGPAKVTLLQAPHVRWDVTLDGEPIDTVVRKSTVGLSLLGVDVPHGGRLAFAYRRTPKERAGGWLSLFSIAIGLASLGRGRPLRPRPRSIPDGTTLALVSVLGGVFLVVGVRHLQGKALVTTWQHFASAVAYPDGPRPADEPPPDALPVFHRDLVLDDALDVQRSPSRACNGLMGKDVLPGCSEAEHAPVMATAYRAPYLYRCVEFGLPPGASAEIPLGDGSHAVTGLLVRRLLGSNGKGIRFGVAREPKKLRTDSVEFHAQAGEAAVATLVNGGRQMERFCIAAAEVGPPPTPSAD
ncbi:MAG: hypothetical protein AAGA54_34080 [Myxococcota bacterium]